MRSISNVFGHKKLTPANFLLNLLPHPPRQMEAGPLKIGPGCYPYHPLRIIQVKPFMIFIHNPDLFRRSPRLLPL